MNVVEKTALAGLSAGKTHAEAFPSLAPVDYMRESSLSRAPTEVGVELSYRPFRRTFLRFGYNWEGIKREWAG